MAGYGTDEGFSAYVAENGYTLPDPLGSITAARQRGSAYIDSVYGSRFTGSPTGGIEQERAWPRTDAEDIYENDIGSSSIPSRVIHASYEAAFLELVTPGSLSALVTENEKVKRLKAGSVEIEFAESSALDAVSGASPLSTKIDGLLYPLIGTSLQLPAILVV